jgi:hypothetical protein
VTLVRKIAVIYAVLLTLAALTNYIPGLTDAQGWAFGIFALDIYDDALHLASATWAAVAAYLSSRASTLFLRLFGTLYLLDGLMGLAIGSGYLDLGVFTYGVPNLPFGFKILANLPHIVLGGFAVFAGFAFAPRQGDHGLMGSAARLRKVGKGLMVVLIVLAGLIALPVFCSEATCRGRAEPTAPAAPSTRLASAAQRPEVNSYLSYPEWYIVHAYEDFAGVPATHDEYAFGYLTSIGGFWSSFCSLNRLVSGRGATPLDTKVMLYTIGVSFTGELVLKGLYETTLGRLTAALRGNERTAEDRFALAVAEDYARFLRQTPWYECSFGATLVRFWRETPISGSHMLRKVERRLALSAEFAATSLYARLIGLLAGLSPAELRLQSVVRGADMARLTADPQIKLIGQIDDQHAVIETPCYRAFTELLTALSIRGDDVVEIAGNDDILVTVRTPRQYRITHQGVQELFAIPIQSRPGWRRVGLDVKITELSPLIRELSGSPAEFEHVYDY